MRKRFVYYILSLFLLAKVQYLFAEAYSSYVVEEKVSEKRLEADVTIDVLESSLQQSDLTDYARSTTLRNIARLYMLEKNWLKAAATFEQALSTEGLSLLAQQEMLYQLMQVYTKSGNFAAVVLAGEKWLASGIAPTAPILLTMAGAYAEKGQKDQGLIAIINAKKLADGFDVMPYKHFLRVYYKLAHYDLAIVLLKEWLLHNPEDAEAWALLSSAYIANHDNEGALSTIELANKKGMMETEAEILRLADLYMVNNLPIKAALVLETYLERGLLAATGDYYERLYQAFYKAKEFELATEALRKTAQLKVSGIHYLQLAQMLIDLEKWQAAIDATDQACKLDLPARHFGKAFLFRGIAQFNLQDLPKARHSFINATRIGTEREAAAGWLRFMEGEDTSVSDVYSEITSCS